MIKALALLILAGAAAGAFFFFKQPPPAAPIPLAQVQGTSFDVPVKTIEPPPAIPEVRPEPGPEPPKPPPEVRLPPADDKPVTLTFARLQFRYLPQARDKGARDPFPREIKALDGKKVVMDGFMFPIDFEKGKVRSFTLSNGMFGCCFGDAPAITETIKVYRTDGKLMPYQSMARVTGTLEIGEEYDADGYVDSVYRIRAEDVGAAQIEHK